MGDIKTHKVVKNEGIDYGMNYLPKVANEVIKTGSESELRKYFDDLHFRSLKQAEDDTLRDCKRLTKSKNCIHLHTIRGTVLIFEMKKLTRRELEKYNTPLANR